MGGGSPHPCTLHQGDEWCWTVLHKQVARYKVWEVLHPFFQEFWKTGRRRMPTTLPGWRPGSPPWPSCRVMWRRTTPPGSPGTLKALLLPHQLEGQEVSINNWRFQNIHSDHQVLHHPLDLLPLAPHRQLPPAVDPTLQLPEELWWTLWIGEQMWPRDCER